MNVKVKGYNGVKYNKESKKVWEVEYKNIQGFEVKKFTDAEWLAQGYDEVDENQTYLIITTENGETASFRNSHVDMFSI